MPSKVEDWVVLIDTKNGWHDKYTTQLIRRWNKTMSKLGFSDSFGCCGHWQFCSMGVGDCYYESIDPEAKNGCHCYQRNHKNGKSKAQTEDTFSLFDTKLNEKQREEETFQVNEKGQLSFF